MHVCSNDGGQTIETIRNRIPDLGSDLYRREKDGTNRVSCQFTTDMIAMNAADFIIASICQEFAGTRDSVGQYASHPGFSMPGPYRVVDDGDVFDPTFNIVSPGAEPEVYYPQDDAERRLTAPRPEIDNLVYGDDSGPDVRGVFKDCDQPLLFNMAGLDRIKNISGLTEWFVRRLGVHLDKTVAGELSGTTDDPIRCVRIQEVRDEYRAGRDEALPGDVLRASVPQARPGRRDPPSRRLGERA